MPTTAPSRADRGATSAGVEQRAEREPGHRQPLEHAEHAREHVGRRRSLQERPPATSSSERPAPAAASSSKRRRRSSARRPAATKAAPRRRTPSDERRRQACAPDERDRDREAERRRRRRRLRSGTRRRDPPRSSTPSREHDVEDVERADRHELRRRAAPTSDRADGSRSRARGIRRVRPRAAAPASPAAGGPCTRARRAAPRPATTPAITAKTAARRGDGEQHPGRPPARRARSALSIHPETTFVAVSSSGARASAGHERGLRRPCDRHAVAATAASA